VAIEGVVLGAWPDAPDLAERCNREDLHSYTGAPLIGVIPHDVGQMDPARFQALALEWIPMETST
jgi:dethiobiotin synthetase